MNFQFGLKARLAALALVLAAAPARAQDTAPAPDAKAVEVSTSSVATPAPSPSEPSANETPTEESSAPGEDAGAGEGDAPATAEAPSTPSPGGEEAAASGEAKAAPSGEEKAAADSQAAKPAEGEPAKPGAQPGETEAEALIRVASLRDREDLSKNWRVTAALTQSLGQGSFVRDPNARRPLYSYSVNLGGLYRVHPLVYLTARLGADQQLTLTNNDQGTIPREFFIRDFQVGATSFEFYREKEYTDIRLNGGVDLLFPLSKVSRDQELVLASRVRFGLWRLFQDIGPGYIRTSWNAGFRYNFSPPARSLDAGESPSIVRTCSGPARNDGGDCFTSLANPRYSFSNSFTVSYFFLDRFAATIDFTLVNGVNARLNDSEIGALRAGDVEVGTSRYANGSTGHADLTVGTLEIAYDITANFSASFGLLTQQNPYIQRGANSKGLRFPFWDFSSTADNLSTIYLDVAFAY